MPKYTKYKKPYKSTKKSAPRRQLTEEQLQKMKEGREAAQKKREEEIAARERAKARMEAISEIDGRLRHAAQEEAMYERYARRALKSRRNHKDYK